MGQVQQQVASESSAECASAKEMLEVRSLIARLIWADLLIPSDPI